MSIENCRLRGIQDKLKIYIIEIKVQIKKFQIHSKHYKTLMPKIKMIYKVSMDMNNLIWVLKTN